MKARRRRHSKMSFLRKSCVQILTLRKKFFCIFYFFMRVLKESKKKKPCCCKAFKKWEVRFSIKLFKKRTSFIWSEWWGSNPRASRSQTARSINWTTPGYSVFLHDTMRRRKKQVFRVCGQCCGQARFCGGIFRRGISAAGYCPKDFQAFTFWGMDRLSILPNHACCQLRYIWS